MLDKCVFKILRDFAVKEFFSYESLNPRKEEKLSTNELPPRGVQDSPLVFFVLRVAQVKKAKDFFADKLHTRASTGKPRKPLSPPGLVYRHKKGGEKVKKKKDQGRREGGSSEGKVPCALNQEFLFFGSRVFGFGSGPSQLKYRLLRDLVYEEAMCKGSSGNGLLYAAKAVP